MLLGLISTVLLITIDRLAKYLAVENLKPNGNITLINGVLGLTFLENPGAAFGILPGGKWFLIGLSSTMIIVVIIYYLILLRSPIKYGFATRTSLVLIMAGAIGNLIDRLFNDGYVIDFFQFKFMDFPIFNTADIFIISGAVLLAVLTLFFDNNENKGDTRGAA